MSNANEEAKKVDALQKLLEPEVSKFWDLCPELHWENITALSHAISAKRLADATEQISRDIELWRPR